MSIWDDLYIINEAKSAKQLVAEMSQEIKMKPKENPNKEDTSKSRNNNTDDLFASNEFDEENDESLDDNGDGNVSNNELLDNTSDEVDDDIDDMDMEDLEDPIENDEDDFSDIETDLANNDISDEDIDNVNMDDELANSDAMMDDNELDDGAIEETDEDKSRHIHLLSCVNQLYDTTLNFSKKVSCLDDFPSENLNKLIRLLDFYREYRFDSAKPEDVEKVVKASTKILKSLAQRYRNLMNQNVRK